MVSQVEQMVGAPGGFSLFRTKKQEQFLLEQKAV